MKIQLDDLRGPEIAQLLTEHLQDMYESSPPESVHALDLEGLRKPEISFWTGWLGQDLVGCIALKTLDATHGEIKSMRTDKRYRGQGHARLLLTHLIGEARRRGMQRLSLETGSMDFFTPARQLYASCGFQLCLPFADYWDDPNSVFMTLVL